MAASRTFLMVLHVLAAALFAGGVRRVFIRGPDGVAAPQKFLAAVAGSVLTAEGLDIARAPRTPIPPARLVPAVGLYLASLALFVASALANRDRPLTLAYSADPPSHLQQTGPYRFVRHPFYTSYLFTFAGGSFGAGSALGRASVALMLWTYWNAAKFEEKKFASTDLREDYALYAREVGMFLPRIRPRRFPDYGCSARRSASTRAS
jgi:protein-S-isoprenylcysteine O-methyltransferase Ste14